MYDLNQKVRVAKEINWEWESSPLPNSSIDKSNFLLSIEKRNKLKELIAENKFIEFINELKELIKDETTYSTTFDELIILKSRLNQVYAGGRKGTLSSQEENLELNKIRDNLLAIINTIG